VHGLPCLLPCGRIRGDPFTEIETKIKNNAGKISQLESVALDCVTFGQSFFLVEKAGHVSTYSLFNYC
jgi:hypothetical protein